MQLPILLEPLAGGRFRAHAGFPFVLVAEGDTVNEAVRLLSESIAEQVDRGARLTTITLPLNATTPASPTPFPADNLYQTDWAYRELHEAIEENRRQEAAQP